MYPIVIKELMQLEYCGYDSALMMEQNKKFQKQKEKFPI